MNKSGVPKEPQDDALSDDTTGGRRTPTGRPTRGNVVPSMVFFLSLSLCRLGEEEFLELFLGCRTSGKEVIVLVLVSGTHRASSTGEDYCGL